MTLINSCWPNSFSHLILLLLTFAITFSQNHSFDQRESRQRAVEAPTSGHDREIDNKHYDNLFDFKTDVHNLLFHSHGNLMPLQRHRRDVSASNLILNLSHANFTNLSSVNVNASAVALNLSHNLLTSFDDDGKFQNLTSLDVSFNRFSSFQLKEHSMLQTLDASRNVLVSFSCTGCEYLRVLNLSHNALASVTLDNLVNLDMVDLSDNLLSTLDTHLFHKQSILSVVILACNRINAINKDLLFQLRNLRRLDLSHNDISDIENDAFNEMLNLQILDLSFNRIHIAALQALQNIPQLARLSIAGNVMLRNALRAFAVIWSIMELDYSHVGLCQVPDSLAQSVRILNLYGNFLNIIASGDFESYPFLHKLILSYNNLTSIEDDALGRLEMLTILHLDHNKLTQIPPGLPSSLIKLYMHNNLIMELHSNDLMSLINLQVLDLSHNRIIYMPQLTLPTLITLSVRACGLEDVNMLLFKACPSLRLIDIDGNLIKCAQLMEIEQCIDDEREEAVADEYFNNNYNADDVERRERHLNSISYFPNDGGCHKCNKDIAHKSISLETVPNCWNEQKLITSITRTNETTTETPTTTTTTTQHHHTATSNDNKLQNVAKGKNDGNLSSETTSEGGGGEKAKLALSVDVVRTEIKALKNNVSNGNKSLSLANVDAAHRQKGLNNLILMKTKQFKSENGTVIQLRYNAAANDDYRANNGTIINRNSIDNGAERVNAIKDNGKLNNNKSKSIAESRNGAHNGSVNGTGNESIDATDHQHMTINHSMRERWNDIRGEGNVSSHPGLLIVFASTVGVLFTFIVVYVYRCNFINSARRRGGRLNGSCENINEGRDVLNDNFNEEIHSFTIETHSNNNSCSSGSSSQVGVSSSGGVYTNRANLLTATPIVNHCDLLPMDILNSTLSHSQASHVDNSNISMHLW